MTDTMQPGMVTLTQWEMETAGYVAMKRAMDSVLKRRQSIGGRRYRSHEEADIIGAMAEIAVAKLRGVYWPPSWGTFHDVDDVTGGIEVRATPYPDGHLIAYREDKPGCIYVLVTGMAPTLCVRGWIRQADACRGEWWRPKSSAYFVPQSALGAI